MAQQAPADSLQQATIDSVLKEKEFKEGDNQDQCPICLAQFNPRETVCVLPCQHSFHRTCVERWIRDRSPTCPVCRHSVLGRAQAAATRLRRNYAFDDLEDLINHTLAVPWI